MEQLPEGFKFIMGKRTKLVYLVGKSEKEFLSYDEYDAHGSGIYFQDNPVMAEEYTYSSAARAVAKYAGETKLDVYMWEIADGDLAHKSRVWLQFTHEEAMTIYEELSREAQPGPDGSTAS